jgi:hypothetical protein
MMKRTNTADGRMGAIARGVQARLEEKTDYSRRLTRETVDIARALGIADREIERWVHQRETRSAESDERIQGIKRLVRTVR